MRLRDLPSVDELARTVDDPLAVEAARTVLSRARETIAAGGSPGDLEALLRAELRATRAPRLRRVDDLGSGVLVTLEGEPSARDSLAAGAAVVCFSGDKLLGGPQAGVVVGRARLLERLRRHPLQRALRADKLTLAALEGTLGLYLDPGRAPREVPVAGRVGAGDPRVIGALGDGGLLLDCRTLTDAAAAGAATAVQAARES